MPDHNEIIGLHNALLRLYLGAIKLEIEDLIERRIREWEDGKGLIAVHKHLQRYPDSDTPRRRYQRRKVGTRADKDGISESEDVDS